MADDFGVQIADALVSELNNSARSWNAEFAAETGWLPIFDPADKDGWPEGAWKVTVVPVDLEESKAARSLDVQDYGIAIDFQKRIDFGSGQPDNTAMRAASKIVQDVHDFLRVRISQPTGYGLATLANAKVIEAKRPNIYFLAMLQVQQIFEAYLDLKVRMVR